MTERRASVFVCDEVFFATTGKVTIQGVYTTGDIAIPGLELRAPQLVFFFSIDSSTEDPLVSFSLRVTFPDSEPNIATITPPVQNPLLFSDPRRKTISIKQPYLIQQPLLKPGRIETAVIHDKGEIDAGSIWITSLAQTLFVGNEPN